MLTPEDKQWIVSEIAAGGERMAARLTETEERLTARVKETEERLTEAEERMAARMEKIETALLTEFHKWASPVEMRQRTHAAALRAIDAEMEALSDRVKKLEAS